MGTKSFHADAEEERVEVSGRDLKCVICMEIPIDPVESDCCGGLFCKKCALAAVDGCSACNAPRIGFSISRLGSRLIQVCTYEGCAFECYACDFRKHVFESHLEQLTEALRGQAVVGALRK